MMETKKGTKLKAFALATMLGVTGAGDALISRGLPIASAASKKSTTTKELISEIADYIVEENGAVVYRGKMIPELFEPGNMRMLFDKLATSTVEYPEMEGFAALGKIEGNASNYFLQDLQGDTIEVNADRELKSSKHKVMRIDYTYDVLNFGADSKISSVEVLGYAIVFDKKGNPTYHAYYVEDKNTSNKAVPYPMERDEFFSAVQRLNETQGKEEKKEVFFEDYNIIKERADEKDKKSSL